MRIINANAVLKIDRVKEWQDNPRGVKQADLERLKNQIKDVGVYKPIIVIKESEKELYTVIGGNMRLKALTALGYKEIWCCVIEVKDETEKVKISLSDNDRIGFYNDDELAYQIKELDINLEDYKVDLSVPDIDLQDILDRNMPAVEGEDNVPEVTETDIKSGDMFQLGRHRLLCGDCTVKENYDKLKNGKTIDMVLTDPPYGISYEYNSYKDIKGQEYENFCEKWYNEIKEIGIKVIFIGYKYYKFWYNKEPKDTIYWIVRNRHGEGLVSHFRRTEQILIWGKIKDKFINDFIDMKAIERLKGIGSQHTCPKPVEMFVYIITHAVEISNIVLDCFLGSGTTLIACEKTDRICFGMEIDPLYCQVIIKRWEKLTGGKAVKI